jgi:eukaryotic-like serine/threonine-protein kinase
VDAKPIATPGTFRFGDDFELNVRAYELRSAGIPLKLKPIAMELLLVLIEHRGEMVTREQIVERLWGKGVFLDTDNSINGAISKIRQVLRDDAEQPRFVQTVTGKGYRFIAPVTEVSSSAGRPAVSPSPSPSMTPMAPGGVISHYRIREKIASGGMGVVYEAEDIRLGRKVALKCLPENLARDSRALERLMREARAASSLNHPNICTIYEIEEHEGGPIIVMELLQGQTLTDLLRQGPAEIRQLLDVGIQVTSALEAAHASGLIHRDIKPANIFVMGSGRLKILDFGLVKLMPSHRPEDEAQQESLTVEGVISGTTDYMSPEQVRGEELDARSDLFSLGVVLYEMATGHGPFAARNRVLTMDAILNARPAPPSQVNPGLPAALDTIVSKALEKDRNLRYQSAAEMQADLQHFKATLSSGPAIGVTTSAPKAAEVAGAYRQKHWKILVPAVVALIAAVTSAVFYHRSRQTLKLTDKDTVVLAEFINTTGDPVFESTLRQGLSAQLEQSPFLTLLSDERIAQTLALMAQPKDARLTYKLATQVCQRTASAATIEGSISTLGSQYVLGLRAVNCRTGDSLADEQVTANRKEQVLKALGNAATKMREKLGESLSSVRKYDVPLENVTTTSLEALNAYSLGLKARREKGPLASIPFFQQAIELDPSFAMAYLELGTEYWNFDEMDQANPNLEKAFALRDRVSTKEGFAIASAYHDVVTGDLQKADKVYQLWAQTYPQDRIPLDQLGNNFLFRGQYPQALEVLLEEKRLAGSGYYNYYNLVVAYLSLNRVHQARLEVEEARARKLAPESAYGLLYSIDFLEGNASGMRADLAWAAGKPGIEDMFFDLQSDTEAYSGHRTEAWAFSQKAVATARRDNEIEVAAIHIAHAALREAEFGNSARAAETANSALALASSRDVKILAALTLARAGFARRAQIIADELAKANPSNTILNTYWLPTIRAATDLDLNHPAEAIEILQGSGVYELGQPLPVGPGTLYPVYVRGEAYLRLNQASSAAGEFQKLLDHPGCVLNFPLGALAHLQLGRAYALAGDKAKSRAAYQDFFNLWKDADPDIPILQQAKAEYGKLNSVSGPGAPGFAHFETWDSTDQPLLGFSKSQRSFPGPAPLPAAPSRCIRAPRPVPAGCPARARPARTTKIRSTVFSANQKTGENSQQTCSPVAAPRRESVLGCPVPLNSPPHTRAKTIKVF